MLRAPGDSVTLAHPTETRTEADFDFKLCLWRFTFLNRTKPTKYEALEKNAVSRPILPKIGNLRYSRDPRKPHFCSGIFGLFVDPEAWTLGRVAEGEELGSNLLQVIERTRSGLDRHRLWQQYNGIWILAISGRAEMGVLLIRRIRAYVTGENISLYVLGWDLLDIVPVQRNRRFVAVE
jgi:hypothetical protein